MDSAVIREKFVSIRQRLDRIQEDLPDTYEDQDIHLVAGVADMRRAHLQDRRIIRTEPGFALR